MTEDESSEKSHDYPVEGHASLEIAATVASLITESQTQGVQSLEYSDVQIRVEEAAHQRRVEQQRLDHELAEAARDSSARRLRESREDRIRQRREDVTFAVFLGTPIAGLVFAAALSLWTTDQEARQFAHNLISLIFGGILGGLTGYFTGRSSK